MPVVRRDVCPEKCPEDLAPSRGYPGLRSIGLRPWVRSEKVAALVRALSGETGGGIAVMLCGQRHRERSAGRFRITDESVGAHNMLTIMPPSYKQFRESCEKCQMLHATTLSK